MNTVKNNLRIEYGRQLSEAGTNPNIIVLEGDLKESTQSIQFQNIHPERFFEMGIAEQNMVGVASGLARCGKIPIVHSFASFISLKACEQVRTNLALQNLNVKLVVSHAGISAGSAGSTHHSIEDIAIMRSMPNMTVLIPGDRTDLKHCFKYALDINGPVYLRISASEVFNCIPDNVFKEYQPYYVLSEGTDLAIITTGITLNIGEELKNLLSKINIETKHIQLSTIKPFNREIITDCANTVDHIITIEEHNIIGGLGSAVAEIVSNTGKAKLFRFGINDHYCSNGSQTYMLNNEGLNADTLFLNVKKLLGI